MRIASFLRAGIPRRYVAHQVAGHFEYVQSPISYNSWGRLFHSEFRRLVPLPVAHHGGQQPTQERCFSRGQKSSSSAAATVATTEVNVSSKLNSRPVIYRGPLSDTLRKVKILSLTSCCLSVVTGPALVFLTSPHLSVILKGGVAATVMILSASTTAALHWFVGPYIHKLTWIPGSKEIEVETLTWMATYVTRTISAEDIRPAKTNRPFVSFAVDNRFYFVDPEKITNKDLLRLVTFYKKQKGESI